MRHGRGYLGVALAGAAMTTALLYSFEAGAEDSTLLTSEDKQLVEQTLEQQTRIAAVDDAETRARTESRGASGTTADELVRINGEARARALTIAIGGMALTSLAGTLAALRLPRSSATGRASKP